MVFIRIIIAKDIAYRLGEVIHWADVAKKFKEEEANKLTKVSYRDKWQLPKVQ